MYLKLNPYKDFFLPDITVYVKIMSKASGHLKKKNYN